LNPVSPCRQPTSGARFCRGRGTSPRTASPSVVAKENRLSSTAGTLPRLPPSAFRLPPSAFRPVHNARRMTWWESWFGEEYLELYPHRDLESARREVAFALARLEAD